MNTRKEKAGAVRLMAAVAVLAIAMSVFAGVAVYDEADAADITYISGDIKDDFNVTAGTIAVINGNLNIKNGATFTVAAGATLTINKDVKVTVDGIKATTTTGDDASAVDKAEFVVDGGARVVINGQLVVGENGKANIASTYATEETTFYAGTFVYGTVAAQKGAELTINAEIMKDGVVDVSSSGKKVSSISGELLVMPGATVDATGKISDLCVTATGEDKSKAADKNVYLGADMDIASTVDVANASDASSVKFTATAENSTVYTKTTEGEKTTVTKTTVVAASLAVEGKIANATLDVKKVDSKDDGFSDKECKKAVEVSASNVIANELQIAKTGAMKIDADLDVSGKLTVLFDTTAKTQNMEIVGGTVTVSGTVDLVNGSLKYISKVGDTKASFVVGNAILKIENGTFTVDNTATGAPELTAAEQVFAGFEGAYYIYGSTTSKFIACELAAAIAAADGKYVDEVTVSGAAFGENADDAAKKAGYVVAASFEVPADVTLHVKNALVVGKDVVVTVNAEADLDLENGIVFVDGKLVDKTGNDDLGKKIIADVIIADAENSVNTYTSLKIALTEITSGKIQLKNDATVSEDLTVPKGVTVDLNGKKMTVSAGATLTVAGTVDASTGTLETVAKTDSKTAGKVAVENRVILASEGTFNEDTFNLAGIYVNAPLDDGNYFVMSVPTYVENLADVVSASVQGTVSYKGDLALSGTADEPKTLDVEGTFSVEGKVVLAFFTIDVKDNGIITATVSNTVGAVELASVKGTLTVADIVDDEGKAYLAVSGTPAANTGTDGKNVAKIAISSGVLTINDAFNASNLASFGVAADTTLAVAADATVSALKVEGTLDVQKAVLTVSKDLTVLGAVAIADDGKVLAQGDVFVGVEKSDITTTGAAASVTGKALAANLIYVAAGSSVSDDIVKNLDSTEFVVSGSTWVTVYGDKDQNITIAYLTPTVKDAKFVEWQDEKGVEIVKDKLKVGSPAKAIAYIDENIYSVKVIGDNGIGTVAIDGKVLQKSSNVFFVDDLKAGAHTITCELKYGFEGTVVIKVNGTAISGNSFTLSGTGAEDTSVSIDISGTKAIEYDPTPVAPAEKDDGMGLTDYLLIVLVVLVVILAIIAIMRFMRS